MAKSLLMAIGGTLLTSSTCAAQTLGQGDDFGVPVGRIVASLVLLLVVGGGIILWARRNGTMPRLLTPARQRRLAMIETMRMTPQSALCLAAFDGNEYLIAVTSGGATLLQVHKASDVPS
jgi:hypothetical protein